MRISTVACDSLKKKNVRKYLGVTSDHLGKPKAEIIGRALQKAGATVQTFQNSLNRYSRLINFQMPLAVISTDTSISRRDAQAKLPKVIINAWTGNDPQMLQAGAYRYAMSEGNGCLVCQHWSDIEGHPDLMSICLRTGINPHVFRESIRENTPLKATNLPEDLTGLKFVEGYQVMCDTFHVETRNLRREFGVPFLAGVAGALLGLSLVSERNKLFENDVLTKNLLKLRCVLSPNLTTLFLDPPVRRADCICADEDYLTAYRKKWDARSLSS